VTPTVINTLAAVKRFTTGKKIYALYTFGTKVWEFLENSKYGRDNINANMSVKDNAFR
jgi:hypothetical protein